MKLSHDHIHCVHKDVEGAVNFYKTVLGAVETNRIDRGGAPQITLDIQGADLILRGRRENENPAETSLEWPRYGIDHFAFRVEENLGSALNDIRERGGIILAEGDVEELTFAYIQGPEGVVIELLELK
tara:strand:- start:502 stop:885 length:384 start_codon:yes stop_codon:yes gene_type:complete